MKLAVAHKNEWIPAVRYALLCLCEGKPVLTAMGRWGLYGISPILNTHSVASCGWGRDSQHTGGAPDENCTCGLYAAKDEESLIKVYNPVVATTDIVMCKVELAGKIIEGEDGYRAERMRILEVILNGRCWCGAPATKVRVCDNKNSGNLVVTCTKCAEGALVGFMTPQGIAQALGTEVRFGKIPFSIRSRTPDLRPIPGRAF